MDSDRGLSSILNAVSGAASNFSSSSSSSSSHQQQQSHGPSPSESHGHGDPASSGKPKPSAGNVASSAKLLMEAAVGKLHKAESDAESGNAGHASKAELAAAASEVMAAARHYGKLDDKTYGKYIAKAEDYLRNYGGHGAPSSSSYSAATASTPASSVPHSAPPSHGHDHAQHQDLQDDQNKYMKYLKKAEEFLSKR